MNVKVYDCFPFLNEIDLLHARLNELGGLVDKFIIVESTKTFAGRDKILYYEKYKDEFKRFHDKITYIVVDDMPEVEKGVFKGSRGRPSYENRWKLEKHQFDKIYEGIRQCRPNDIVHISAIDEIPKRSTFHQTVRRAKLDKNNTIFQLKFWEQRKNIQVCKRVPWTAGFITQFSNVRNRSIMNVIYSIRCGRDRINTYFNQYVKMNYIHFSKKAVIPNAGHHFSYIGSSFGPGIKFKVQNFTHDESSVGQELVETNVDYVELFRAHRDKMLNRFIEEKGLDNNISDNELNKTILNFYKINREIPKYILDNISQFMHFVQ